MLAAAHFVSRDYAAAKAPLLAPFRSVDASRDERAAAAYGLCGVYQKLNDRVEQIHYALWLHTADRAQVTDAGDSGVADKTIYWAFSGWDLNLLLETEARRGQAGHPLPAGHQRPIWTSKRDPECGY
jgi:hypothetical protein